MKKLKMSDLISFYNTYFSPTAYSGRYRPTSSSIINFLVEKKFAITEKSKEILAMFVWDFWNIKDCSRLNIKHLTDFCKSYDL